jgi:hypothetical protein
MFSDYYFRGMKPQTLKELEAQLMHFVEDLLEPMGAVNGSTRRGSMYMACCWMVNASRLSL